MNKQKRGVNRLFFVVKISTAVFEGSISVPNLTDFIHIAPILSFIPR